MAEILDEARFCRANCCNYGIHRCPDAKNLRAILHDLVGALLVKKLEEF